MDSDPPIRIPQIQEGDASADKDVEWQELPFITGEPVEGQGYVGNLCAFLLILLWT